MGGFYKHFRSKDDLLAEAVEHSFAEFDENSLMPLPDGPPAERWKAIIRKYLSLEHCDKPETGCPVAALAPDIGRASPAVKKRVAGVLKARRELVMQFMPGATLADRGRNFNIIFPAMAGAISVARMLPEAAEREKILNSMRDHLLQSF